MDESERKKIEKKAVEYLLFHYQVFPLPHREDKSEVRVKKKLGGRKEMFNHQGPICMPLALFVLTGV